MPDPDPNDNFDNNDPPVAHVDFGAITTHKSDDGLNTFTDDQIEKITNNWNSQDPTKAKFRTADGKLDVPKLTKSYLELESRLGRLAQPLPDTATEKERFEYRKHLQQVLGVPDTPDGYEITLDALPDGFQPAEADMNALKLILHKHNGSRELMQAVFDFGMQRDIQRVQAEQKQATDQHNETAAKLKSEWGPEKFAENDELLQRYLRDFAGSDEEFDALFNGLRQTRFAGGSPVKLIVYKALCKAAEMAKGEGATIFGEMEHRMSEQDDLKKRYPKSYKFLSS